MYYALSVLSGFLIAVMVVVNGGLTEVYGAYSAAALIHAIGLIAMIGIILAKKEKPFVRLPLHFYLGGVVGVATTVFTNLAYGRISVSAILGLALLGQSLASLTIDRFGLFHMPRRPFDKKKLFGLLFVLLGIVFMLQGFEAGALAAVTVSLLSGVTIVVSRSINAALSERTSVYVSTLYNYITGLAVCIMLLPLLARGEAGFIPFTASPQVWVYTGGLIGVAVVTLSNVIVTRVSSFYVTLLTFVGQVFTGILLDMLLTGAFAPENLFGGLFVAAGLTLNLYFDRKTGAETEPSAG